MKHFCLLFFILCPLTFVWSADRTIHGVVVDDLGEPVIGASVMAGSTGTITDFDGNFSLTIPEKEFKLTVSYIGYKTRNYTITGNKPIRITLEEDVQMLTEVVAVGYGSQKKVNLTGAIENVDMSKMDHRPISNASLALQGQVSGVMVVQNSGQAGEDQGQIRIRGVSSMENNNAPLVIIDGLEGDINDVDAKDIASMTVMKDASSAAIYGNKAASGVILITTKQGEGDLFQVDYTYTQSWQEPTRTPDIIDGPTYITLWNEANRGDGNAERFNLEKELDSYTKGTKRSLDWYDVYFNTAPMQKHHINLILSSGPIKSSTSFTYLKQDGMMRGTGYNNFNYRTNISAETKRKIARLDIHVSGYRSETEDNTSVSRSVLNKINSAPPYAPFITEKSTPDDVLSYVRKETDDGTIYSGFANFIGYKENGGGKNTIKNRVNNNYVLTVKPVNGLELAAQYGFYYLSSSMTRFLPVLTLQSDLTSESGAAVSSSRAELTEQRAETFFQNGQITAKYNKVFKNHHHFGALLGFSLEDESYKSINTRVTGFVTNVPVLDFGENPVNPTGAVYQRRSLSFFGRLNYNYHERYLLEFNIRGDGSSRFLPGYQWGVFPSGSVGWRMSEEEWFSPAKKVLHNLKLRASYGLLGNENIYSKYAGYDQLKSDISYAYEGQVYNAIRLYSIANKNATWEKTRQLDVGLDMNLFGKLNITADYYRKNTYDILARVQVSNLVGTESMPYQNIGEMLNTGWELSADYRDRKGKWRWEFNGMISGQRNELIKLNETKQDHVFNQVDDEFFSGYNMIITQVGQSYGSYYGYQVDRIFQVEDFVWQNNSDPSIPYQARQYELRQGYAAQSEAPRPGDLKFKDLNNDGIINDDDRTIIGKQLPDLMYSFGARAGWNGLDFGIFFQGVAGCDVYTGGYLVSPFFNSAPLLQEYADNRWTYDNPSTTHQRVYIDKTKQKIVSDYYINDASYLRLKSIELSYTLPSKWMKKIHFTKIQVFGNIQNLVTWSKIKSFDPEKLGNVVSSDFHPQARIYSIGLNVVF